MTTTFNPADHEAAIISEFGKRRRVTKPSRLRSDLMSIDQIVWSRRRVIALFDAALILTEKRSEVLNEPNNAWDRLYNAQRHLMLQLEVKEAA